MRLLTCQGAVVVVGDAGIQHDADVGGTTQSLRGGRHLLPMGDFHRIDVRPDHCGIPTSVFTRLLHHVGVLRVETEHVLRQVSGCQILHLKHELLTALLAQQTDRETLASEERNIVRLAGQRIGAMYPGAAAGGDQVLSAQCRLGQDGCIPPCRITVDISILSGEACLLASQWRAVVKLLRASGPDSHGNRIDHKGAIHGVNVRKMGGYVFAIGIIDPIFADAVFTLPGICLAAGGRDPDAEAVRQAGDQHVRGTGQGRAIVKSAGRPRHQCDRTGPGPVALGRVRLHIRPVGRRFAGHEKERTCLTAVSHAPDQRLIGEHLLGDKGTQILMCQGGQHRRYPGLPHGRSNGKLAAGRNVEDPPCAVGVRKGNIRGAFQHAENRVPAFLVPGFGQEDNGAADARSHGGGLDVQALVLVELF